MTLLTRLPEDFLHHIWRTCNFDLKDLHTEEGNSIFIRYPGTWNHNQGPDFFDARLRIDGLEWHGQVELHVHSQDWYKHRHHLDPAYNNTILHVVLTTQGKQIFREDGTAIPELVLKHRISPDLVNRYHQLQLEEASIPCQTLSRDIASENIKAMLTMKAIERVQDKAHAMHRRLKEHVHDWEEVLWQELLSMMGGPVNREVFRDLARRISFKKLRKQLTNPIELEALLFGVAGMLTLQKQKDTYYEQLRNHWEYLRIKLSLKVPYPLDIRFMRMRPASFPTIRISQSVQLIRHFPQLIKLLDPESFLQLMKTSIYTSPYWETHYRFFEESEKKSKSMGRTQKAILITNTLLPLSLLYQEAHGRQEAQHIIKKTMDQLAPEKNKITQLYERLGWANDSALSSQGMIQLNKSYCQERRCLYCEIGKEILA